MGCIPAGRGILLVKEKVSGNERLKALLKGLVPTVDATQFGDPVSGMTVYAICLYDGSDALVATLEVDRAGATCAGQPCWKALGTSGFRYSDAATTADGVQKIIVKGGDAGKGRVLVKAKNNTARGQTSMPVGITAALESNASATVQVLTDDADCFTLTLTDVQQAASDFLKAVEP
jgi:hypothetical protein